MKSEGGLEHSHIPDVGHALNGVITICVSVGLPGVRGSSSMSSRRRMAAIHQVQLN